MPKTRTYLVSLTRTTTATGGQSVKPVKTPDDLFDRCIPEPNSGCWIWTGARTAPRGYGQLTFNGRRTLAHIAAVLLSGIPIPDGFVVDHKCRVRSCANPAHLEPVTVHENNRRASSWEIAGALKRAVTHCPKGHEYTEANVKPIAYKGRLHRACRECARQSYRTWRQRKLEGPLKSSADQGEPRIAGVEVEGA